MATVYTVSNALISGWIWDCISTVCATVQVMLVVMGGFGTALASLPLQFKVNFSRENQQIAKTRQASR